MNNPTWGQSGTITAKRVNLRSGPGKSHSVIKKLSKSDKLLILEILPKWLKIFHEGKKGYVWRAYVTMDKGEPIRKESTVIQPSVLQTGDADVIEAEACRIDHEILESKQQVDVYTEKETDLIEYLDQTDRLLNQTNQEIKDSKLKLAALVEKQNTTQKTMEALALDINALEKYAGKRFAALYKLHQLGKIPIMASATSLHDLLFRLNSLSRISSNDEAIWHQLNQKKENVKILQASLSKQKEAHLVYSNRLEDQLQTMAQQKKERSNLLKKIRKKKALTLAALEALRLAAEALDRQLEVFSWTVHPVIFDTQEPAGSFHSFKGLLKLPVMGKIERSCRNGNKRPSATHRGIDIKTDQGEPIQAVYSGKTIYADWFKGYGNMIIIDHGNNFCSVYAHLQEFFKEKGDTVDQEEVIGTVGDTGSLVGPKLHFEIRYHGKPVDPLAWLKLK